ncbi:MAG: hypothetical protein LBU32_07590 [Clostridiales bacterium]|nr:hypothetical protein [Clostridiales bacterium]
MRIVQSQLATDLNCTPDDFYRDGFEFCDVPETLVTVEYMDGNAAGMAGACDDFEILRRIGINVLPESPPRHRVGTCQPIDDGDFSA